MTEALRKDSSIRLDLAKIEQIMMFVAVLGPLGTIPQIVKIYFTHTHHVHGLSLSTWVTFSIISILWLFYGLMFRRTALIVANVLYTLVNGAVVVGILIYSNSPW